MFVSAVLITGGSSTSRSAEIYNPLTNTSCSLPQLPEGRNFHSQDGGLTCGGGYPSTYTNCVKWSPASGTWNHSHTLKQRRSDHKSWATTSGVYLIGGYGGGKRTSEKVKDDGSVEEGFSLKYDTRLEVTLCKLLAIRHLILSSTDMVVLSLTKTRKSSSLAELQCTEISGLQSLFTARLAGREPCHH